MFKWKLLLRQLYPLCEPDPPGMNELHDMLPLAHLVRMDVRVLCLNLFRPGFQACTNQPCLPLRQRLVGPLPDCHCSICWPFA